MNETCKMCPGVLHKDSEDLCLRCYKLHKQGWPTVYDGPILAGARFQGFNGFIWDGDASRPGFIRVYTLDHRGHTSRLEEYHELVVRACRIQERNDTGHVVRPALRK